MKINIKYKFGDIYTANLFLSNKSLILRLFGILFSFFAFDYLAYHDIFFGTLSLIGAFIFIPQIYSFVRTCISYYRNKKSFLPTEFIIDTNGIKAKSPNVKSEVLWKAFTQYDGNKNILILYRNRLISFYFLKSMFSNEHEWRELIETVRVKVNNKKTENIFKRIVLLISSALFLLLIVLSLFILISVDILKQYPSFEIRF